MPEDSKKQQKGKHDPKEQRRPRHARHQQASTEKMPEKKAEESKAAPTVTVPEKPVYENPGPEFYKNLKRETDEILKITEEEKSKYKKKEIQSNWAKYEMPIETYEDIEEQENMGADYEKLIQAPLSVGGHFQFKHEKSWDLNTGPSLYDKYFDVNMGNLAVALSTIPFYERNSIDKSLFSETDILTMNNRSIKFKQKYYKDKSYSTPETEAQEKILNTVKESIGNQKEDKEIEKEYDDGENINIEYKLISITTNENKANDTKTHKKTDVDDDDVEPVQIEKDTILEKPTVVAPQSFIDESDYTDDILLDTKPPIEISEKETKKETVIENKTPSEVARSPEKETKKNPLIESPEDLEKWLDDFLDG